MMILLASILALGIGPLMYAFAARVPRALSFIDGFVLASVGGLVLLFVVPDAWKMAGWISIPVIIGGVIFPIVLESKSSASAKGTHRLMLMLAMVGLVMHTMLDGLAIGSESHEEGLKAMSLAVVMHRLPVGLAVWALLRPRGRRYAFAVLAAIIAGTVFGYSMGGSDLLATTGAPFALFQAFVAGSLLHVVMHENAHVAKFHRSIRSQAMGAVFGALGVGAAIALSSHSAESTHGHTHHEAAYWERLSVLMLESAPALLLGFVLAGLLGAVWKIGAPRWIRQGSVPVLSMKGMLVGLPLPICSCGVVPIYNRMVRVGVPPAAAASFLVATPELGIESLLLSIPLLGVELTAIRLAAAALVALAAGMFMGILLGRSDTEGEEERGSFGIPTLGEVVKSTRDVVDDTIAWILAGLAIAAIFSPESMGSVFVGLPFGADVLLFALIGIPAYVCASGATPLAAAFIFAGVSPGAALVFLLVGPATNVTTFGALTQLHGRRVAILFGGFVLLLAIVLGITVNLVFPSPNLPDLFASHESHSWLAWAGLAGVGVLFLDSLFRKGPRVMVETLSVVGSHHHSESCDECDTCENHQTHEVDSGCGCDDACSTPAKPAVSSEGFKIKRIVGPTHVHDENCKH